LPAYFQRLRQPVKSRQTVPGAAAAGKERGGGGARVEPVVGREGEELPLCCWFCNKDFPSFQILR
jgi:hypothetical protein